MSLIHAVIYDPFLKKGAQVTTSQGRSWEKKSVKGSKRHPNGGNMQQANRKDGWTLSLRVFFFIYRKWVKSKNRHRAS